MQMIRYNNSWHHTHGNGSNNAQLQLSNKLDTLQGNSKTAKTAQKRNLFCRKQPTKGQMRQTVHKKLQKCPK